MADLVITASALLLPADNYTKQQGIAGATITAGQTIYLNTTTVKWHLAQCDGTAAEACSGGLAVALNNASANQPLAYIQTGNLDFGAIITAGTFYVLSDISGGIQPVSDFITSTWLLSPIGYGTSTTTMALLTSKIGATGVALA